MKRKLLSLSLLLTILLSVLLPLPACAPETPAPAPAPAPQDIVILFTNDVHGAVDADIGYAGLAAYRNEMKAKTPYVTLVDCGDHTQGSYIGAVSRGAALVEIMNGVGLRFRDPRQP